MESEVFNILNKKGIEELEKRIQLIDDEEERRIRQGIVDKIFEDVSNYESHIQEYEYNKKMDELVNRGVKFVRADRRILDDEWDQLFDSLVPIKAKLTSEDYNAQYKWHIFSFKLLKAIEGDAAVEEFEKADKENIKLFYQHSKEAYSIEKAELIYADDLKIMSECSVMDKSDIYIYNPEKKWTYIKTHEQQCGPYFFQA